MEVKYNHLFKTNKMKKTILFSLSLSLIMAYSCNQESITETPEDIQLGEITALLPLEKFEQNSFAVFKNKNGEEVSFQLSVKTEEIQKSIGNMPYKTESIKLTYTHPNDSNFTLYIKSSGKYIDVKNHIESIECFYDQSLNQETPFIFPRISIDKDGNITQGVFHESDILLNTEFQRVYKSRNLIVNQPDENQFNIYYTPELGFIGFETVNNELWVFERFD